MTLSQVIGRLIAFVLGIVVAVVLGRYAYSAAMSRLLPPSTEIVAEAAT